MRYFVLGAKEFRLSITTNCGEHQSKYDSGREWAHRLTFRYFEPY